MTAFLDQAARHIRDKYCRRFAFVHINKTGGRSIEQALGLLTEHETAMQKIKRLGRQRWNKMFTFAIVRNPWDRVVSQYHYRLERNKTGIAAGKIGFTDWVNRCFAERDPAYVDEPRAFTPQIDWIADSNREILVEFVGRFERLEQDFKIICKELKRSTPLPHLNKSQRGLYRDYYDRDSKKIVSDHFRADIDTFEYTF